MAIRIMSEKIYLKLYLITIVIGIGQLMIENEVFNFILGFMFIELIKVLEYISI